MANKGRAIYLVYTDLVEDKYDEAFNAWYDTRHLPQLKAIPGILDAEAPQAFACDQRVDSVVLAAQAERDLPLLRTAGTDPNRRRPEELVDYAISGSEWVYNNA